MAAFLANVGVNAGHAARSPLFDDGTFRLIPIPERLSWRTPMLRFGDLPDAAPHAPKSWRALAAHLDPDLDTATPTYGDNCRSAGRAFSLRRATQGDFIVFMARLSSQTGLPRFGLVGCLIVEDVLPDVVADPGPGWWDSNAHVRRARGHETWNSFWLFKGGPGSRLFRLARPFARRECEKLFGESLPWHAGRSELQNIASCTRAVRRVDGDGARWLRTICQS